MPDAQNWNDRSSPVREGEELDAEVLQAWLREHVPDWPDAELAVEQFPRGYSNLTYRLRAGAREAVLRRPPFGAAVKGGHDMGREYRLLRALHGPYGKVPEAWAQDETGNVLGAPFYVMERLEGVILRPRMPEAMHPDPATMAGIADALVDGLADLHAVDLHAAGLADFGRPEGYAERQIEGWTRRWRNARTDEVPAMERVAAWLADRVPPSAEAALIHNDWKYDNLVLDPEDWTRVRAVLDWEMATVGHPLLDLGTSLGYWVHPGDPPPLKAMALSPSVLPGNPSREDLLQRYARRSGRDPGNGVWLYAYGLFKIAVIVQQIYARYRQGKTKDPRFRELGFVVQGCAQNAAQAIDKGRVERLYEV